MSCVRACVRSLGVNAEVFQGRGEVTSVTLVHLGTLSPRIEVNKWKVVAAGTPPKVDFANYLRREKVAKFVPSEKRRKREHFDMFFIEAEWQID